ncbi:hypothetical protein EDD93_4341 [Streptomyces sp. 840.1]|uniref:hypothetical protein n=1 Tax=Streptomyces sp. 840.1 TaxID=2485152 RepID=UPI000F47E8AC|nr:hypothetical protein [Streptomyces sp. 840.1]ROQ69839.1 hypothetical protein EDD93_4341 [Streptomyces sp. 840.1]
MNSSSKTECGVCHDFDLAEAEARREKDESRATDCRVLRRRHSAADHPDGIENGNGVGVA